MNTIDEITSKVINTISEQYDIPLDKITSDSRLVEDLGGDSLDVFELCMWLDEDFEISIYDDRFESLITVQDVVKTVNELLYLS